MNQRIAQKIVQRVTQNPDRFLGYTEKQVKDAYFVMGRNVDDAFQTWKGLRGALVESRQAAVEAASQPPVELPQEMVVKVGAVEAKIEAGDDGLLGTGDDVVTLQATGTAEAEEAVEDAIQALKDEIVHVDGMIKSGEDSGKMTTKLVAYRAALQATIDGQPTPTVNVPQVMADLSVSDLKAICKKRGLSGYTQLKKAELVNLLSS